MTRQISLFGAEPVPVEPAQVPEHPAIRYAYEQLAAKYPRQFARLVRSYGIVDDPNENREGAVGNLAPETSKQAALALFPRSGTQRRSVLDLIARTGGVIDEQGEAALGLRHQSYGARRWELCLGGWIEATAERIETVGGGSAIVWRLTEWGLTEYRRLAGVAS